MSETDPQRPTFISRIQHAFSILTVLFLLSWLAPVMIIAAPILARSYIHVWKVVLGMEPDCAFPAAVFRWGKPDCAESDSTSAKKTDRLGETPAK